MSDIICKTKYLKLAIKRSGKSETEILLQTGLTDEQFDELLQGECNLTAYEMRKIAKILDEDVKLLFIPKNEQRKKCSVLPTRNTQ